MFGVLFGMLDHCLRAYTLPRAGRSRKISELLLETLATLSQHCLIRLPENKVRGKATARLKVLQIEENEFPTSFLLGSPAFTRSNRPCTPQRIIPAEKYYTEVGAPLVGGSKGNRTGCERALSPRASEAGGPPGGGSGASYGSSTSSAALIPGDRHGRICRKYGIAGPNGRDRG